MTPLPCTLSAISSPENLLLAAQRARRGKRQRPDVEAWWQRRETEVMRLSEELSAGKWNPRGYRFFEIREPKRRIISAAPFADRVVHHALCNLMQPLLERRFIARSFSCQVGKGTTAARECCRKLVNQYRYVLKCDVRKFFPSIDHTVLLEKLKVVVRCAGVVALCEKIVRSQPRGLPIGNLTSQLWGNFYLDDMDHRITEATGHGSYLRYTDDFLLFSNHKAELWSLRELVEEELRKVHLELSMPKSRLLACREGVSFCGFVFHPSQRPRIIGATKRRFEKRCSRLRTRRQIDGLSQATKAWYAFAAEGNASGLRRAYARSSSSCLNRK